VKAVRKLFTGTSGEHQLGHIFIGAFVLGLGTPFRSLEAVVGTGLVNARVSEEDEQDELEESCHLLASKQVHMCRLYRLYHYI